MDQLDNLLVKLVHKVNQQIVPGDPVPTGPGAPVNQMSQTGLGQIGPTEPGGPPGAGEENLNAL